MPPRNYKKDLKVVEGVRPTDIPEGLWLAPVRIAQYGKARKLGRQEIGELAGVGASTVSRWLSRKVSPDAASLARLELGLKLPNGTLTADPTQLGNTASPTSVVDSALLLGLDQTVVDALFGGPGAREMRELTENLKKAVLGAVHLLGYPLETATAAARMARDKQPAGVELSADTWFNEMRAIFALLGPPGSGSFPAYNPGNRDARDARG
jgi:transcriptional regulator with XRE-family HTH domain